jgi:hypothetical protein
MVDATGKLSNVERIAPEKPAEGTDKKGLFGGRRDKLFALIGTLKGAEALLVCEGFATGASLYEATGLPVAVAFNAGNLLPVAKALRAKYRQLPMVVCADDDHAQPVNVGLTKAIAAAKAVRGGLAAPSFTTDRQTDFNDLFLAEGPEPVKGIIMPALAALRQPTPAPEEPPPATFQRTEGTPQPWPDPVPFPIRRAKGAAAYPLEALPEELRRAVEEVSRFSKVPAASPAIFGQSVLALAIGKQALVEEKGGLDHHPALFFAGIADSGERKSPIVRLMTQSLERWIDDRQQDYEAQAGRVKANHATIDSAIGGWKKNAAKDGADLALIESQIASLEKQRLPPAIPPRMFTTDPTEQRLFQMMEAHGGGFGVLSGEGRPVFDAILGKYSGDGMNGDAIYLAGISGDTITRDRVGSVGGPEDRYIRRPCLNVAVIIQPDTYLEISGHPSLRGSGAIARLWPVWFPTMVGTRIEEEDEPPLNQSALEGFDRLVYGILNARRDLAAPHRATLSKDAASARRELHNEIERMMVEGGELHDVRDIASKAVTQTVKLALVFHLAADLRRLSDDRSEISLQTFEAAQAIGIYHLQESVRVQRLADSGGGFDEARSVVDWLIRGKIEELTVRTLMQSAPRPRPATTKKAEEVMSILEDHHIARQKPTNSRRPVWEINPSVATVAIVARVGEKK